MPVRPSGKSLRLLCIESVAKHYELICYGCRERTQMNELLDSESEDYKMLPGPFTCLPSSLLEDIIQIVYEKRGLPKESLHQLILPQLQVFKIRSRASRHIQTKLVAKHCRKLKRLEFTFCKSIQPLFYTKFLASFPELVVLNLEGTIMDNEALHTVGATCTKLRELNVCNTTITDTGLRYLIFSPQDPRCPGLVSVQLTGTRLDPQVIAQFLYSRPSLYTLSWSNMSYLFSSLQVLEPPLPVFQLRTLSFSEGDVAESAVELAILTCPFTQSFTIRQADLSERVIWMIGRLTCLTCLHLGNSSFTQHRLSFQEGLVPLLISLPRLTSLTLEKFNQVDVLTIGELAPQLTFLKLSCIGSYLPVSNPHRRYFARLEELVILNTRGAHIYTKILHQLLFACENMVHLRFQFVDTLNDEVWSSILTENPLPKIQTVTFDQCHSISSYTLMEFLLRKNDLRELCVWSCRFIMEEDYESVQESIRLQHYDVRLDWYPYTGQEAPMPLDDIEAGEEDDEEADEDDEDEGVPDFVNFWNEIPGPRQFRDIPLS